MHTSLAANVAWIILVDVRSREATRPDVVSPSAHPSPLRLHGATALPPGNGMEWIEMASLVSGLSL